MGKLLSAAMIVAIVTCGAAFGGRPGVQRPGHRRDQLELERVESRNESGADYAQVASLPYGQS